MTKSDTYCKLTQLGNKTNKTMIDQKRAKYCEKYLVTTVYKLHD